MIRVAVVLPSSGKQISVRRARIGEFDKVGPKIPGVYTYEAKMANGVTYSIEYDLAAIKAVPEAPEIPVDQVEEKSDEWYAWQEYYTYQAALAHEKLRLEITEEYLANFTNAILESCVSDGDLAYIIEPEDVEAVVVAALVKEVGMEDIADAVRYSFQTNV